MRARFLIARLGLRRAFKRGMDVAVSAMALVALGPLLLLIGVMVRLDSPGPALYRSRRVGRDGREFTMLKFRSMRVEESKRGVYHDRITRVGRTLRQHKLDELPQLVNVLLGHMSLVGPRPELPGSTLEAQASGFRPGLTDYASIVYFNLDDVLLGPDPEAVYQARVAPHKARLRAAYVHSQSTRGDIKIMVGTAAALVGRGRHRKRGAAAWSR